jgi:hypothetical protein
MISIFSLLVLVLVQSTRSAIIQEPKNSIAEPKPHHPSSSHHTYIVQTNHLAMPSKFITLESWYASRVDTYSHRAIATDRILYNYGTVMHGFAVRLTDGFMGLRDDFGAWPDSEFGDGIIIGFIDTSR